MNEIIITVITSASAIIIAVVEVGRRTKTKIAEVTRITSDTRAMAAPLGSGLVGEIQYHFSDIRDRLDRLDKDVGGIRAEMRAERAERLTSVTHLKEQQSDIKHRVSKGLSNICGRIDDMEETE